MQDNAIIALMQAEKAASVALVGEPSFRLEAPLRRAFSESGDKTSDTDSVYCAATLADLHEQLRDSVAHSGSSAGENPLDDLALYLYLPTSVEAPHNWLGAACRIAPKLVLVEHAKGQSTGSFIEDAQFFAHGFRKIDATDSGGQLDRRWYAYSLRDYKQAPDWLNARFWAHPERFGLTD